jgi:hypothetical protein
MLNSQPIYEIPPEWIKILAMEQANLSYDNCKTILNYHPLAPAITRKPFTDAFARGFEYSFPDNNIVPEAKERFEKMAEKATEWVIDTYRLALGYGLSGLSLVIDGENPAAPIDTGWISSQLENLFSFNSLDPLPIAGSVVTDLDPNSPKFLKSFAFRVRGQSYHFSRCQVVVNPVESKDYLKYRSENYGFNPPSIFVRALPALQQYLRLRIAENFLGSKVASIVINQDVKSSVYDKITEVISKIKRSKVDDLTNGQVITIGLDDKISSLDLANAHQVMAYLHESNMNDLASSTGWQASYLKHAMLSTGFADGSNDAAQIDKMLFGVQGFTKKTFQWIDDILFYCAWTDSFIDSIAQQYPDIYRGYSRNQIRNMWRTGYERIYNPPTAEPAKDKSESQKTQLDIINGVATLLQQVSGQPALFDFVQNAINTANILDAEIEIDSSELVQQPQGMGVGDVDFDDAPPTQNQV